MAQPTVAYGLVFVQRCPGLTDKIAWASSVLHGRSTHTLHGAGLSEMPQTPPRQNVEGQNFFSGTAPAHEDIKENGNYYSVLGSYRDNGKENGNYYSVLGLYRENGKENGNYHRA